MLKEITRESIVVFTGADLNELAERMVQAVIRLIKEEKKSCEEDAEKMLTREEVAERWRCHTNSIKNYEKRGYLSPTKVGSKVLIPYAEVLRAEATGLIKKAGRNGR